MKVAHILPTPSLHHIVEHDYHMSLGHLIEVDKTYTAFYKAQAERGHYVIMDNGVYETGKPLSIEEIVRKANLIGASEIVLPDYFKDGEATLEATGLAIDYARKNFKGKLMAVPQGKDIDEWLTNAIATLTMDVDVIGIPKWISAEKEDARLEVLQYLGHMLRGREVHLLGCACSPIESQIVEAAVKAGDIVEVRGIDSCIAFKYAEHDMLFADGPRPEGEMDFKTFKVNKEKLVANIQAWDDLASGKKSKVWRMR